MGTDREINNPQRIGRTSATLPGKSTRRGDTTELTYICPFAMILTDSPLCGFPKKRFVTLLMLLTVQYI
jgi:hypothetical protein